MAETVDGECPVIGAISASVHPASANRGTADPRRSWNVTSAMPSAATAFPYDARHPMLVHGCLREFVGMIGPLFEIVSRGFSNASMIRTDTRHPPLFAALIGEGSGRECERVFEALFAPEPGVVGQMDERPEFIMQQAPRRRGMKPAFRRAEGRADGNLRSFAEGQLIERPLLRC